MNEEISQTTDDGELPPEAQRQLEAIYATVLDGWETPEHWYSVLDRSISDAIAKGLDPVLLHRMKAELEFLCGDADSDVIDAMGEDGGAAIAEIEDSRRFVAVSRTVADRLRRRNCRVIVSRGRRRARASHRRVGARLAAKATAAGDPDPEAPRPPAPLGLGGAT